MPPLWLPLAGAVVRGSTRVPGSTVPHRGVDVAASVGEVVRAPAAGKVVFAGQVAGTNWVSVWVAPGVVATVGPLQGELVAGGRVTGDSAGAGRPGHGPGPVGGAATLHLSLRVDGEYLDPWRTWSTGRGPGWPRCRRLVGCPAPDQHRAGGSRPVGRELGACAIVRRGPGRPGYNARPSTGLDGARSGKPERVEDPNPHDLTTVGAQRAEAEPERQGGQAWQSSPCASCSKLASTSGIRPGAGTRR